MDIDDHYFIKFQNIINGKLICHISGNIIYLNTLYKYVHRSSPNVVKQINATLLSQSPNQQVFFILLSLFCVKTRFKVLKQKFPNEFCFTNFNSNKY